VRLETLKGESAIERWSHAADRRTVDELLRNTACGHTEIAYNSCRNRNCRSARVGVTTMAGRTRSGAVAGARIFKSCKDCHESCAKLQTRNTRVVYHLLMKAAAETTLRLAATPSDLARGSVSPPCGTHLGLGAHPPSARAHDRAGGGLSLDARDGSPRAQLPRTCHSAARQVRGKMMEMIMGANELRRVSSQQLMMACRQRTSSESSPAASASVGSPLEGAFAGPSSDALSLPL